MTTCSELNWHFEPSTMYFFRGNDDDGKGNVGDPEPRTSSYQQGYPKHPELAIPGNLPSEQQRGETTEGNDQRLSRSSNQRTSRSYTLQPTSSLHSRGPSNDPGTENAGDVRVHREEARRHTPSLRSLPESTGGKDEEEKPLTKGNSLSGEGAMGRRVSTRTARSLRTTAGMINGSALAGPNSVPDVDEGVYWRGSNAERVLSKKEKEEIFKEESKSGAFR